MLVRLLLWCDPRTVELTFMLWLHHRCTLRLGTNGLESVFDSPEGHVVADFVDLGEATPQG